MTESEMTVSESSSTVGTLSAETALVSILSAALLGLLAIRTVWKCGTKRLHTIRRIKSLVNSGIEDRLNENSGDAVWLI
jgi:hypothetical protein